MLSITMVCGLTACSNKEEEIKPTTTPEVAETETFELANPWVDCEDANKASELASFEFEVAESLGTDGVYRAVEGQIIEVTLGNKLNVPFTFRKALGIDSADLSGDYNEYSFGGQFKTDDDVIVNFAGEKDDSINMAYWTIGDYAYSYTSDAGIPEEVLISYVGLVK